MILSSLHDSERIAALHPLFETLFDYVRTHDLNAEPAGRITIDGERLFINVNDATLRTADEQKLEVHRRYIDVHFPLSGDEIVGWRALHTLDAPSEALFDEANDFALFALPATTYFTAHPGEFYVMYPEDAHAPIIGEGVLHKAIAKVLIED